MLAEPCCFNHETEHQLRDNTINHNVSRYFELSVIIDKLNASLYRNHIDNRKKKFFTFSAI